MKDIYWIKVSSVWIGALLLGLLIGSIVFASLQMGEINRSLRIMVQQDAKATSLIQSLVGGDRE